MTPHYLRFAITIVSGATAACGASQQPEIATAPTPSGVALRAPAPAPSASASVLVAKEEPESVVQGDPTAGEGACRCSWEVKPLGIARVCRVGEHSHTGAMCVRGTRPKYGGMMLGPLPPPDLALA